ncbi:MAG TPA: peptidoglycan -binding protein [Acetobacteraceae bacterium]|jgi:chemotaxis protein MotB|nr:peptidoglycan -binding protein [Acetobacteraceae bacterium]
MPANLRRRGDNGLNAWPGYVDALSTLLMVIIFVLLVFVLAQAFLSVTLSSRDKQLDQVNQELAKLTEMLSLERGHAAELQASIAQLNQQVATGNEVRAALAQRLTVAQGQVAQANQSQQDMAARLAEANSRAATAGVALAEATKTRDQLAAQLAEANARSAAAGQQAADATKFSDSARAQIALLSQQIEQLKAQMAAVARALDLAEVAGRDKDTQIANLGQRLNAALAAKVEELQQYRSEFFGKLRQVLANRPGISVVGDRFVFQSEVLFPVGSAVLTEAGDAQINELADTIKQIAPEIPANIHWIMRVDGHTDRQPIKGGPFASNWELSSARAITVVKLLIADGVAPEHLAATGFADYQPLDAADTPDAYAKNRRIELRLTE